MFRCIPRFKPSLDWVSLWITLKKIFVHSRIQQDGVDFEKIFADYIGARHAISVASGRMGLRVILNNLEFKKKSEIILSSFNYWAIPATISALKLTPIFVDIDPRTCNLDVSLIERKITVNTKAIITTHLYGLPCEMEAILKIAKKYKLFVIEDCVQAVGAEYAGKRAGSFGDAAYFSFGITKNMSLLGGGMVLTNNGELAGRIRVELENYSFLNAGVVSKKIIKAVAMKLCTSDIFFRYFLYPFILLSRWKGKDVIGNIFYERESLSDKSGIDYFRLFPSEIQNTIGLRALGRLDNLNSKRIRNAKYYQKSIKVKKGIFLPPVFEKNIFTSFPMRITKAKFVARELLKRGIDTTEGYMKAFGEDSVCAQRVQHGMLHLPVYPSLREEDLEYIADTVNEILEKINL